jgi:Transcriptional regulator
MEIKQLKNFIKIVEEGNITRAAQKLNMAQPPLSTQMHQLEAELNCVLFQRGSRNIILTDAGSMLYEKAKTILTLTDQIPEDINRLGTAESILHLGIISSVSNYLPDVVLPGFVKQFPNIKFNLYERNTYQLIEAIFSNIVELAIIRTPFQNTGLTCYPMEKNQMYAVGKNKFFSNISAKTIDLKALGCSPLIIYRRWEDIFRKHCMSSDIQPDIECICDDARTVLHWAEGGFGIGIVPESIISSVSGKEMTILSITPSMESDITLVHLRGKSLSLAAKSFLAFLQNRADQN